MLEKFIKVFVPILGVIRQRIRVEKACVKKGGCFD